MIKARFNQEENDIVSFELTGHAEAGPYGSDIVCAAVSALSISVINNFQRLLDIPLILKVNEEEGGYLYAQLPVDSKTYESQLLFQHLYWSLKDIETEYSTYIKVKPTQL